MTGKFNSACISLASMLSILVFGPVANAQTTSRTVPVTVNVANNQIPVSNLSLSPASVLGGTPVTGTVTLTSNVPAGGVSVSLNSANPSVATVPAYVVVYAPANSATFTIQTTGVSTFTPVTITATCASVSKNSTFNVVAPAVTSLFLNKSTLVGTQGTTGTVAINGVAPSGGITVGLSSNSGSATTPLNVLVQAGQTSANFSMTTSLVTSQEQATITATLPGGSQNQNLTIIPFAVTAFSFSPGTINNSPTTGTVTLNAPAPATGIEVSLSSQWPAYVNVPSSMTVNSGQMSGTFVAAPPQMWTIPFTDQVTATYLSSSQNSTIQVNTYALESISINQPSVAAGSSAMGTITLEGPAPAGGWPISLELSNSTFASVPAIVSVPAGLTSAMFVITTSAAGPDASLLLSAHDTVIYHDTTLNIVTDSIAGFSLSQSAIGNAATSTATVTLSSPAPTGGWTVSVTAGVNGIFTFPATFTVPEGDTQASFGITGKSVGDTVSGVAINVKDNRSSTRALLTLDGDVISSVKINGLSSASVVGGNYATGTVTLSTPAPPGGWLVQLSSGVPTSVGFTSSTVLVPMGATSANFTITTTAISDTVSGVAVNAFDGNSFQRALLTVTHP